MSKVNAKAKIQAWLENPTTPYEAWVHLSYEEIATEAGVSRSSVDRYLVLIVARTLGHEIADIKRRRKKAWYERTDRMTSETLERLKAYRSQDPPLSFEECAVRLDKSLWSIRYNCEKYNL